VTEQQPPEAATRDLEDDELTRAVLATFGTAADDRFRTVVQSLVRHVHAFVREVGLTEEEWVRGIDFLTRTGHATTGTRQEFILLSDVLGVSMLVIGINHRRPAGATPSTVLGPFFVPGSPRFEPGDDISAGAPGQPCLLRGRVVSLAGEPVPGARIEVWQADDDGRYDVQYDDLDGARARGHLFSDPDGRFWFWTVTPKPYPIPDDGPVGELLAAAGRSPMRPAHVHFMVEAPGFHTLTTHVFVDGDPYLDTDAVFGVKGSLVTAFERHPPGTAPDGRVMEVPFATAAYDLVLVPDPDEAGPAQPKTGNRSARGPSPDRSSPDSGSRPVRFGA
jgi:hydroxyquinol 1,2-dioxygenase